MIITNPLDHIKGRKRRRGVNLKEIRKEDPYKYVAIEDPGQLALFWQCSEELSQQFPFKAELHQFMLLTAMRKTECLKMNLK